ncbi:hypothetical protein [Actinomadura chokoriensis]|uniref:DUF3558 domain-containing protein n=1 Tax=Actinomadura chokoriensis TaxID=454156 RepID=A0ABV4R2X1_9ACTN
MKFLNARETGLLSYMALLSILVWAPFLAFQAVLGSDDDETVPQRTPLVDLCIWFPYPKVVQLVPKPRAPQSQAIFYGEMQCDWVGEDQRTRLSLSAYRPSGALTLEKESSELDDFYDSSASSSGDETGPAGLGDRSALSVQRGADYAEAHVVVRDGLLVVQVTYRVPGKGPDVAARAREAAVELLRLLPPKGR